VGESVAEGAARIRARYGFRTPDAIQLASAQVAGARVFVTNDVRLRSFAELPVVVLSDHVAVH
jgi:predicted nucleic acid-binding protein